MPEIKVLRKDLQKAKKKFEREGWIFKRDSGGMWSAQNGNLYWGEMAYLTALLNCIANRFDFIKPSEEEQETSRWVIPPMTDPLGEYWDQPPRENITIDGEFARMTKADLELLKDYTHTIPTGKYLGKMWKMRKDDKWHLLWYDIDPDPKFLAIPHREIFLID
jgi:hypothetical protein